MMTVRVLGWTVVVVLFGFLVGCLVAYRLNTSRVDVTLSILLTLATLSVIGLALKGVGFKLRLLVGFLSVALLSTPASATGLPPFPPSTHTINERGSDLFVVSCAPLTVCTIFLATGETPIATRPITVGDSVRWKFDVGAAGGHYYVAVKPTASGISSTLQINTDRAAHVLRIVSVPYVRTITYAFPDPQTNEPAVNPTPEPSPKPMVAAQYKIIGNATFRPASVSTDGDRTYLTLGAKAYQPTVYGIDESGQSYPIHVVPPRYQGDNVLVLDGAPRHFVLETGPGKRDERIEIVRTQ